MSKPSIEEILAPKPEARPRIYAYSIEDKAHKGFLKVGQTTRNVKQRVAEQLKTAAIENYKIELNESAECDDGSIFSDHEVRAALQNATSVASLLLSTEALVAEKPKKKKGNAGGGMPDMGDMDM